MQYSAKIMDHYEHPRNVGSFPDGEPNVGTGVVGNPACGDVMKLQVKVDENDVITDARFKTFGCGTAIASSSYLTELIKGKSVAEALRIKNIDLAEELSLPRIKIHCSVLAEEALRAAVRDLRARQGRPMEDIGPGTSPSPEGAGGGDGADGASVGKASGEAGT